MSPFSTVGSSFDGDAPTYSLKNPSPIFIVAKVNQNTTNIMFDSGSSKSFIKKSVLDQTSHLLILFDKQSYLMADGHSTFHILGTVQIFIDLDNLQTSIIIGIVDNLCVDCLLGMDYMNKYYVNLNNKEKQVYIHAQDVTVSLPMKTSIEDFISPCRSTKFTYIHPQEEKQIQIACVIPSGHMLFSPNDNLKNKGLVTAHAIIPVVNYIATVFVYNSTMRQQQLDYQEIIGEMTPYCSTAFIATIFDSKTKTLVDEDQTHSLPSNSEDNIHALLDHIDDQQQVNQIWSIFKKHHQLFDTTTTTIAETDTPHIICTENKPPTTSRPYPQTIDKQNATFEIIQQMIKNKQIRPSYSQYSAPILLIKKRDGSYRFIVDYRKLNNITIQDKFPLPNLEQALQMVGGRRYYSKLDLRSGYFQIPIKDDDKHKTAFITTHGLFEFNVLAQGLKNSPPSFQRIMSSLLLPCKKFCIVYLDDVLIYSDNFDQHLQHVNQVLAIFNKHKFQLNPQKCEVFRTNINYLGHTISHDGVRPLQERIEKILSIPQPTSLAQANAFIGAIGWYRKFIPHYARIAAPILAVTNLTKAHKHKFHWDQDHRDAFEQLKTALITEPLFLTYPDDDLPLTLATDASDNCIGGVLFQEDANGQRKNIYFHSQMLPKPQRKWPTIEKEALAIYYCTLRMKLYLLGREFTVYTDHCPLRNMHLKPSNNRRVDRISLILQQYNIKEIRHVSGKCNCMADYLSRYPRQVEDDDDFIEPDYSTVPGLQSFVAVTTRAQAKAQRPVPNVTDNGSSSNESTVTNDHPPHEEGHDFDVTKIGDAQKQDSFYQEQVYKLQQDSTNCSFELKDDILYKIVKCGITNQKLVYVPSLLVSQVVEVYHGSSWAGHFGFRRTYNNLKDRYWWPKMKETIKNHLQSCLKCQKFNFARHKTHGFLHPIESPNGPFQMIGIDYSGPFPTTTQGNKYVLAITDYFTKWVIAIPVEKQNAQTTAEVLYEHYICIYGVPRQILSDQGTPFNNQLMEAFTKILGCHHIKSTPYHPQTNGAIERFNATFERQLAKVTNVHMNDWDIHLKSVVFAYNIGKHASTEYSPYQLQFGRHPNLPPDPPIAKYEFSKPNDYFQCFRRTLTLYHRHARENIIKHQQYYKKHYDVHRANPQFNVGDWVLKRLSTSRTKLSSLYSDPMTIIKVQHPTYWIQDGLNDMVYQVHVSQLRSCSIC
jgi:transposase InsO family protein